MHADTEGLIARLDQELVASPLDDPDTVLLDLNVAVSGTEVEIIRTPGPEGVAVLEVVGHAHPNLAGKELSGEPGPGLYDEPTAFLVDRELAGPWRREFARGFRSTPLLPPNARPPVSRAGGVTPG